MGMQSNDSTELVLISYLHLWIEDINKMYCCDDHLTYVYMHVCIVVQC